MIVLKDGTALQKDVIENIIKEMLESGVVRPSQSPLSLSIVLVKKKDGTWVMSVDYLYFSKSGLRSRY